MEASGLHQTLKVQVKHASTVQAFDSELDQTPNHIHTYIFWESEVYNTTPLPIYIGKILQLAD